MSCHPVQVRSVTFSFLHFLLLMHLRGKLCQLIETRELLTRTKSFNFEFINGLRYTLCQHDGLCGRINETLILHGNMGIEQRYCLNYYLKTFVVLTIHVYIINQLFSCDVINKISSLQMTCQTSYTCPDNAINNILGNSLNC